MKQYYKICRIRNDKYYSMNLPPEHMPSMNIEYKLNEWVQPKLEASRLFAYHLFEKAMLDFTFENMYNGSVNYALFECKVRNPILANTLAFQSNTILARWKYFPEYRRIPIRLREADCVVVTEIMLTKRIK
jgi:hypothetical protein